MQFLSRIDVATFRNVRILLADTGDLAAGRLVRPFDLVLKSRWSYYVVYPEDALRLRKVKAFRAWLFEEMGTHKPEPAAE